MDWAASASCVLSSQSVLHLAWTFIKDYYFKIYFYVVYGCFAYMCIRHAVPTDARRGRWISPELVLCGLLATLWILEIEPKHSGRATSASNHWTISLALFKDYFGTTWFQNC